MRAGSSADETSAAVVMSSTVAIAATDTTFTAGEASGTGGHQRPSARRATRRGGLPAVEPLVLAPAEVERSRKSREVGSQEKSEVKRSRKSREVEMGGCSARRGPVGS